MYGIDIGGSIMLIIALHSMSLGYVMACHDMLLTYHLRRFVILQGKYGDQLWNQLCVAQVSLWKHEP